MFTARYNWVFKLSGLRFVFKGLTDKNTSTTQLTTKFNTEHTFHVKCTDSPTTNWCRGTVGGLHKATGDARWETKETHTV